MKAILSGLALLVAAPAMAVTLVPGPVQSIPTPYHTRLGRPAVSDYRVIAAGVPGLGGVQSQLFTLASNSVTAIGSGAVTDNPPVDWAVNPNGYAQNDMVGIAGSWVAGGGAQDSKGLTNKLWYLNGPTAIRAGGQSANEKFVDVDANGKAIWIRWNDSVGGTGYSLMYQDLATNPAGSPAVLVSSDPASPVYNADFNDSACANIADGGSGKLTWSSGTAAKKHYVYDLNTMTNSLVYTGDATIGNAVRSRISDDGNWIVWNSRGAATQGGSNRSDIMLCNVANVGSPVTINLTNDLAKLREDPTIEVYGDNTAIIVWGERDSAQVAGNYEVKGMVVTNLSGTPTAGPIVTLATEAGIDLRYPDIDKNMIVWARSPNATTGAMTQYMLIPEPASLALLALGGLAMARRR